MQLKPGDYIYHTERGVGRIQAVVSEDPQEVVLAFQGKDPETLPGYLLDRGGAKISPLGLRALAYSDPEAATKLLQEDPIEAVCLVLEDFPGYRAKTEDLKDYLAPYIEEWDKWWEITQPLLKENPRIDLSKSRLREYGIHQELQSRANEAYRAYRRIKPFEDPSIVYAQARRALAEHFSGPELTGDPLDDLLAYFNQVITSADMPTSIRFDAIFRLEEWKAISPDDFRSGLEKLLTLNFTLAELDTYPLNRLVEYLLKRPDPKEHLDLLAGGILAGGPVANRLIDWAERSGQPEIPAALLLRALSDELPVEKDQTDIQALNLRIKLAGRLLKSTPASSPVNLQIVETFQQFCRVISKTEDASKEKFLGVSLLEFAQALYQHISKSSPDQAEQVLDSLVGPKLPLRFIVMFLDLAAVKDRSADFREALDQYFLNTIEQRKDDFLLPLVEARWKDDSERIIGLVELAKSMDSSALIERSGQLVCELLQRMQEIDWDKLLSHLVQLIHLPGSFSWKSTLSAHIEEAYLSLMQARFISWRQDQFHERAVVQAAKRYARQQSKDFEQNISTQQNQLAKLREQINDLEQQLNEKETLIRELRSGLGGDTAEARFEERSRLLKELVNTIAEFERYAASQAEPSKELQAVLRRLENISSGFRVISQEAPGKIVEFNPQVHRLMEGGGVNKGDPVLIVERGFLIRDHSDKLRLLKPAIVKKQ